MKSNFKKYFHNIIRILKTSSLLVFFCTSTCYAGFDLQINAGKITDGVVGDGKWHLVGSWKRPAIENALSVIYGRSPDYGVCTLISGGGITRFTVSGIMGNQVSEVSTWGDTLPERMENIWVKIDGNESYAGKEIVANCELNVWDMVGKLRDTFNLRISIDSFGPVGSCGITLPGSVTIPGFNASEILQTPTGNKLTAYSINVTPQIECTGNTTSGIAYRFTPSKIYDGCIGTNMNALSICLSLDGQEVSFGKDINQVYNAGVNSFLTFTPKVTGKEAVPGEYNGVLTITLDVR